MSDHPVCIAGAHRSGTSMLTRLLHDCGLYLGNETDLMAAAEDNPDGFWENLRFVKLNEEILNLLGGAWDLPPRFETNFESERFEQTRLKAKLLIEGFSGKSPWGWKDPRTCLTMSFWQSRLPDLRTVIIVRNPLEAAYSMHERNGTSYAFGLRLWEIYNRHLFEQTPPKRRLVSHYDLFFKDPEAELRRIAAFAGLDVTKVPASAGLVRQNRRHTTFTAEQLVDAGASEPIVALYQSLIAEAAEQSKARSFPVQKTAGGQENKTAPTHTGNASLDELAGAPNRLNVSIPEGETVRRELAMRRGAMIQDRKAIADLEAQLQRTREEIATRDGRIAEMEATVVRFDHMLQREQAAHTSSQMEVARLNEQHERGVAEVRDIRERLIQTNQLLHAKSISQSEIELQSRILTEQLQKQFRATKKLRRFLEETEQASVRLRDSRRWKMANPFASFLTLFSKHRVPGFGHLDKVITAFRQWRKAHPEIENIDAALQALTPRPTTVAATLSLLGSESGRKTGPSWDKQALPPAEPIEFPTHNEVDVSIVIPVFNQCSFTQACLASLQKHDDGVRFEVIVVDDCSSDATPELIGKIPGITYLTNESNSGFIVSCNRGAQHARGRYLLFLNNDTTVTPGWLAMLCETFQSEPRAGLVGSKLVYPDGRLQEAGGIIWRDASGWNRGKFQDADKPEYNYLREVDYCSAASLMIPRDLFESVGGFDLKYAPCYYEDTDLAFKIRAAGRKVLYQPLSKVLHFEGATGGTDISTGAKKHQEINRATFAATWAKELAEKPANGDIAAYEALKPDQKRILVIDHHLPMPDRDSGSLRMFQILRIMQQLGHRVSFIPDNLADISPYGDELRKHGIEVLHHPHLTSVREYLETHGTKFDFVILSRCDFARKHIDNARRLAPQSRIIFDTVDLHFLREDREANLARNAELKSKASEKRELEYQLIDQADETWVVSPVEQDLIHSERPNKAIEVVSNIVHVPGSNTPFSLRHDILFIGSFQHTPNIDAVVFFCQHVFPLVLDKLPKVKFYVIGDKAPPEVVALGNENVVIAGYQPEVRTYFDSMKLSVAPLRFGAGVKGKINQSMGYGVPVIATSIAVEGMSLAPESDVLIADEPAAFAAAVTSLYQSEELWNRLSQNALEKTKRLFSMEAAREQLDRLLRKTKPVDAVLPGQFSPALDLVEAAEQVAFQVPAR